MNTSTGMRLSALAIVALSLIGALTARLWFLTAVEGDAAVSASESNRLRTLHIQAPRGRIFDRDQQVLVDNRQVRQVRVDTRVLDEAIEYDEDARNEVYGRLADILALYEVPVDPDVLEKAGEIAGETEDRDLATEVAAGQWTSGIVEAALEENFIGAFVPTPVASEVPEDLEILLAENQIQYPGVDVDRIAVREYPHDTLAAHVLGYVGPITGQEEIDEVQDPAKPYDLTDEIGRSGVESTYERWLRGTPGERVLEVDAAGNVVQQVRYVAPEPGMDIVLSLDIQVQALLEQQLAAVTEVNSSPAAAAMVEDPRNGAVIAMASYPTYSPNDFANGIGEEEYAELTDPESGQALLNRAISGEYPAGSTFKPVTALAALRSGFITPETSFNDEGFYFVQGCDEESCRFSSPGEVPLGTVNLQRSLTVSSDSFYYWLGDNLWANNDTLGDDFLQRTAADLGFTAETEVDLASEREGFAFTPEIIQELHDENPEAFPFPEWRAGNTIIMSIGQGDLGVTPIQMTNAYAALANGGTLYRPHLGGEAWTPDPSRDTWISDPSTACDDAPGEPCAVLPSQVGAVELPADWRDPMIAGLLGVQSGEGTAAEAFSGFDLGAFPIAGKTGTAQVTGKGDFAWYVGFGPVRQGQMAEYVVSVIIEAAEGSTGGFGGDLAAPVARRMFDGLSGQVPLPMVDSRQATPLPSGSSEATEPVDEPTEGTDG